MLKYTILLLFIAQTSIYAADQSKKRDINVVVYEQIDFWKNRGNEHRITPLYTGKLKVERKATYGSIQKIIENRIHRKITGIGRIQPLQSAGGYFINPTSRICDVSAHHDRDFSNQPIFVTCEQYSMD